MVTPSLLCLISVVVTACGGGSSDPASSKSSDPPASSSSSPSSSSSQSSSGNSSVTAGVGPAARLAAKLGKPARLLVGLGGQTSNTVATIQSEELQVDIYDTYLGVGDWTQWNQPPCDFVCVSAQGADSLGAVPMYTQYQMANNGDGNLSGLTDSTFMTTYWSRVKLLFQDIATYGKPALVNFEPDFWGYTEQQATANGYPGDPSKVPALVTLNPDCASLTNDVAGVAGCLLHMAREYAPNAYVGFPPSTWGGNTDADVIAWMNSIGAQNADFIVEQTLDRDAGCYEAQASDCQSRSGTGVYWDETNQTHPNFDDYLATVQEYHQGIGGLPVIFWQTPEGVPSDTPGGTPNHYRDNREDYFLKHPTQLTAVGGLGVVFSVGDANQTDITTDNGQFETLHAAYMAAPAPLP